MQYVRIAVAAVVLVALGAQASVQAQTKPQDRQRPPIIINEQVPRPPPPAPHGTYVGPGPSLAPPMERIQPPPPLSPALRP